MVYLVKHGEFEITKRIRYTLKSESKDREQCMKYLEVGREKVKSAVLKSKTKPLIGTFRVALVGAGQLFGE